MRLGPCALAAAVACVLASAFAAAAHGEPAWTTYHRDAVRSGYDPDGSSPLTPAFAWQSQDLGAPVWSQPLVLGSRMYVATVGNRLYALEAATGAVAWVKDAGPPVPSSALPCGDVEPTVGIVGTPVIDPATNAIYAVADVWDAGHSEAHHELVGYSLATSEQVLRTRIDPPGVGRDYLQRPGLNLDGGNVIVGMGGNDGDCGTYRGTIFSVPENGGPPSFWQVPVKVKTNSGGAVWGTSGPAVDGEGRIITSTGNPNPGGEKASVYDYSDSLVELSPALSLIGWFEPPSWEQDSNSDTDLGSAGPELLPGGLVFQAGKNGTGYLVDQATMGGGAEAVFSGQACGGAASFGGDAYVAGVVYVACSNGVQALAYNQAGRSFSPLWKGPHDAAGPPIVSAGLVWVVATHAKPANKLYGLDPATGAPRYTETLPSAAIDHFASPSAAGGRLFVASGTTVTAFQIALPPPGSPSIPPPRVPPILAGPTPPAATATLVGTRFTVSRSGRFTVKVRCPSGVSVCRGTITVRTLKAVSARARGAKARAAILTLATAAFSVPGGHVKAVTLRLGPRARRLLLRRRVLRARATVTMHNAKGALQSSRATVTLRLARRR
jgi:outer membrane protein assembly factor BamB